MDWKARARLRYRPDAGWFAGGVLGCVVVIVLAGLLALKFWHDDAPLWMIIGWSALAVIAVHILIRMAWVGVRVEDDRLVVSGVYWSRTIPHERLESVNTESAFPWVRWRTRGGIPMRTPLTTLWPTRWDWTSADVRERNREYLRVLLNWIVTASEAEDVARPAEDAGA